jgi:hypothetical protein
MPTVRVALFTADPTETGDLTNEVVTTGSTGYARQAWSGPAASGGSSANDAELVFPANGSVTAYTVTHVGLVDSPTRGAGNVLASGPITNKTIAQTDQYRIAIGALVAALT